MAQRTKAELDAFYNSQPAKRIGSSVLVFDQAGRLLIVKPNYKDGWSLVGGLVESNESPLVAAQRETSEEIGVTIAAGRFILYGFRFVEARNGRNEDTQIIFRVVLTDDEVKALKPQESEIAELRWVNLQGINNYTDTPRMQAVAALLEADHAPVYLHNEKVVSVSGLQKT